MSDLARCRFIYARTGPPNLGHFPNMIFYFPLCSSRSISGHFVSQKMVPNFFMASGSLRVHIKSHEKERKWKIIF